MPTHIALLRGVNVGGAKVSMTDLRRIVASLGHTNVATYIQSGNVVFTPARDGPPGGTDDLAALADDMREAIGAALGIWSAVVVLTASQLADVVGQNPFPDQPDPRRVHAVFLPTEPGPQAADEIAALQERAARRGGRDEAVLVGRTLYLHTPDGFGRSDLASLLLSRPSGPAADGTARNWATVTRLLAMCED